MQLEEMFAQKANPPSRYIFCLGDNMYKTYFLLIFLFFISIKLMAEGIDDIQIDKSANGKHLITLLDDLEGQYQVDFIYNKGELSPYKIYGINKTYDIKKFLNEFLYDYSINQINSRIVVIVNKNRYGKQGVEKDDYIILKTGNGTKGNFNGHIADIYSKESLVGADVVIPVLNTGTRTDKNGFFEVTIPESIYRVDVSHVGYEKITFLLAFSPYAEREAVDLLLFTSSTELENITIIGNKESGVQSKMSGIERLGIDAIKNMPAFMGEVDPVRSIATLPGVSTNGELSSGFNVRGGEAGQNLIIQEGAVIFVPTHLFGLFSAFNPDLINDIKLYKGGGPANYGGRASSVLNIDLKNGNLNAHTFTGGAGLVSSHLMVEGPIIKNKLSYIIGGRLSYSNWLIRKIKDVLLKRSEARFHDLTSKLVFYPGKKNLISVTGYYSYDDFKLGNDSIFSWNTKNLSLKWDHVYNGKLSALLSAASSNYESNVNFEDGAESFFYRNSVNNLALKYELQYTPAEKYSVNAGMEISVSSIEPGKLVPMAKPNNVIERDVPDHHSMEMAAFMQNDYDILENLGVSFGLRYSQFYRLGRGEIYMFDYRNLDGRYPSIVDTLNYKKGEIITRYGGFEPRLSVRYTIDNSLSLKASYYRTNQYLHLISNTITPSPLDFWISSGPNVKPETSDQYTLGIFKNMQNDLYEFSFETFYKKIGNALDYIEGADLVLKRSPESGLSQGLGRAYGIEIRIRRNEERINGWVSYTYSRSLRKYDSEISILNINSGAYYASMHDQPHNLSIVLNYRIRRRFVISMNFNCKSGRPITIPVSKFSFGPVLSVLNYSGRNEYRMPHYNRLDLTITLEDKPKRNRRFRGEWNLSLFNVYGRENAYSIFFDKYGMAHKVSILGSVFPSLSYDFKF